MDSQEEGKGYLRSGSRLYGTAALIIATEGSTSEAGDALARCLPLLRSAMNWLENTEDFETAHRRLDAAGELQKSHFRMRCRFTFRNGGYWQECPVALAHNRVGTSIGAVIRESECSICRRDPDECEHIAGRIYNGEDCFRVITRLDLDEVSLVGRPNFPDARFESVSVDIAKLRAKLGETFEIGMDVFCDRCSNTCRGVARPFDSGHP